jgi:hypothetical protein
LPEYAGQGDPEEGYYAGLPGKVFARVLEELWTEVSPTGAYWNPTRVVSDSRLAAMTTDTSEYVFDAPVEGDAVIEATLFFRRAFKTLADQKGWDDADIVVAEKRFVLSPHWHLP